MSDAAPSLTDNLATLADKIVQEAESSNDPAFRLAAFKALITYHTQSTKLGKMQRDDDDEDVPNLMAMRARVAEAGGEGK